MIKGVVLAGGTGERLYPLTKVTNKHLLPVGRKPMILHPITRLLEAEVRDILIVTGVEHLGDVVSLLGSGREYGCRFTYRVQDESGGIAQALGLAEEGCQGSKLAVLLGDNIFGQTLSPFIERFHEQPLGAKILLKSVSNPSRFGVAEVVEDSIVGIEEKPQHPKSNLVVTGLYLYDPQVFHVIRSLKPSTRGELEITDVNNWYIQRMQMKFEMLTGLWTDAGTFESLAYANQLILEGPSSV